MTKKQAFLTHMRARLETMYPGGEGYELTQLHIQNVLPMSERQFEEYERKMKAILKNGLNSSAINKVRQLARAGR